VQSYIVKKRTKKYSQKISSSAAKAKKKKTDIIIEAERPYDGSIRTADVGNPILRPSPNREIW
jgi:hypothetical protein